MLDRTDFAMPSVAASGSRVPSSASCAMSSGSRSAAVGLPQATQAAATTARLARRDSMAPTSYPHERASRAAEFRTAGTPRPALLRAGWPPALALQLRELLQDMRTTAAPEAVAESWCGDCSTVSRPMLEAEHGTRRLER